MASPKAAASNVGNTEKSAMEQSFLNQKLIETGERDRLKQYVLETLSECGWQEELKKRCIEFVQNKGVEKVTIEEITADIAPRGRAMLPDHLKTEVFNRLRLFAEKQGLDPGPPQA
mmetsp:Transcript_36597/g.109286  ORF Transcript_36597/g.109286 Transcript_36597/m.109286 type:complete len:116 (+) Transcript_36597:58-405(+)